MSDPVGVRQWARTVAALLGRVEALVRMVGVGSGRLSPAEERWFGQARRAYDAALARSAREHEAWGESLRWVAGVLFAYADEVAALTRELAGLAELAAAARSEGTGGSGGDAGAQAAVRARIEAAGEALVAVLDGAVTGAAGGSTGAAQRSRALTVVDVAAQGDAVHDVAAWWAGLAPARRTALVVALAPVLGAAAGVPAAVRDRANRAALHTDLAALGTRSRDGQADRGDVRALRNARSVRHALESPGLVPGQVDGRDAPTTLWRYEPRAHDGDGVVAVGVGALDGAEAVAVLVPGVGTEVDDTDGHVERARRLVDKRPDDPASGGAAALHWLGYDTPDHPGDPAMLTPSRARSGGAELAADVDALAAGRVAARGPGGDDAVRTTVLGHSYGSTVVAEAARHGLDADAVALLGSPGAGGARTADDLGVDEVYVARDSRDLVAALGDEGWWGHASWQRRWHGSAVEVGLGADPSSEEFGAVRLRAERPDRGSLPWLGRAHSGYLDEDTESLRNLRRVVTGDLDELELAEPSGDRWWSGPYDPEWTRDVG